MQDRQQDRRVQLALLAIPIVPLMRILVRLPPARMIQRHANDLLLRVPELLERTTDVDCGGGVERCSSWVVELGRESRAGEESGLDRE